MTRQEAEQIALKLREVGKFATQELQFIAHRLQKLTTRQGQQLAAAVKKMGWTRHRFDRVLDATPTIAAPWGGFNEAEIIEYLYGCTEVWSGGKWAPLDQDLREALENQVH